MGRQRSGYSVQSAVQALRYRNLFIWVDWTFKTMLCYQQHAKCAMIDVILRMAIAMQDPLPLTWMLEAQHSEPSLHPRRPYPLRFLSEVIRRVRWWVANKLMFHYRWGYPADQKRTGNITLVEALLRERDFNCSPPSWHLCARAIIKKDIPRMLLGCNENNAQSLINSFISWAILLESTLKSILILFGGRPSFGDFGSGDNCGRAVIDAVRNKDTQERARPVVVGADKAHGNQYWRRIRKFRIWKQLQPIFERGKVGPHFWHGAT